MDGDEVSGTAGKRIKRLKTIDEIYDEVKGYGLVITNDAPLETALNSRIDTARIGPLAITPRHIAAHLGPIVLGRPLLSDLQLISAVSEETGLGFKQVYSEIQNIREIRSHTMHDRENLTTSNSRRIYDSYSHMPTLERAMSEFDPDDERVAWFFQRSNGVAIVGPDLFDDLDKHVNPTYADCIEIFTSDDFEIGEIREVGNDRQLAENAASLIDPDCADDFAIVMNSNSPIADAVRAALYRRGIHFINSLSVRDLTRVRDYLGFISLSMRYQTLRVRDVKEAYSNFGGTFVRGRESFLLNRQGDEDMKGNSGKLKEAMESIHRGEMTFAEVRDVLFEPRDRPLVTMILDELGMSDRKVTPSPVSEMRFAIDNVQNLKHNEQIPEHEKDGVLLADCKNSVFVDRPVVIFLGMEQEWNVPIAGRRYYDSQREAEVVGMRLSALLQQGQRRVYMVNNSKNGKAARPCLTFDLILERKCESFGNVCDTVTRGTWAPETVERMPERGECEMDGSGEFARPFSKSSFNAYASCPRRYLFNQLLPTPERTYTEFGNLIHEFAEFYFCYGGTVREMGVDAFVDLLSDRYAGLSTPLMERFDRDRIRRAMLNVMAYIDSVNADPKLDVPLGDKRSNRFMETLGMTHTSDSCETDHRSELHPVHGVFDLYWDGVITDYKTGRAEDAKRIAKSMDLDRIDRYPEFQPLIYLNLAKEAENPRFEFRQFYAMGRDVESAMDGFDIGDNVRVVELARGDLSSYIRNTDAVVAALDDSLKAAYKGRGAAILAAIGEEAPDDPTKWPTDGKLVSRVAAAMGPKATADEASTALDKIASMCVGGTVVLGNRIIVPFGSIQRFIVELDRMHMRMREQMSTSLPASPLGEVDCGDCPYYQVCTAAAIVGHEEVEDEPN